MPTFLNFVVMFFLFYQFDHFLPVISQARFCKSVSPVVSLSLHVCIFNVLLNLTLTTVNSEHEVTHNNIICRQNEYNSWNTTHFKIIIDLLWTFAASNNSNVHAIL